MQKDHNSLTPKFLLIFITGVILTLIFLSLIIAALPVIQSRSEIVAALIMLAFGAGVISSRLFERWNVDRKRTANMKAALRNLGMDDD